MVHQVLVYSLNSLTYEVQDKNSGQRFYTERTDIFGSNHSKLVLTKIIMSNIMRAPQIFSVEVISVESSE